MTEYLALAKKIHRMLRNSAAPATAEHIDALRELAEQLAGIALTYVHRAVARDLQHAVSDCALERARRIAWTAKRTPNNRAEKVVSRKYGYVWICNPKVASRSIKHVLREADPDAEVIRQKSIADVYAMYPEARGYYSFAFVRDPYRRTLSFYADKYLQSMDPNRRLYIDPFYGTSPDFSFDDLCRWLKTPYGADAFADKHWLSQSRQVVLDDGRLPDFVGRHDYLDVDFKAVAEHLGMPARELPRLNTMAGSKPTAEALRSVAWMPDAHLTERNRALLRERYPEDFALLARIMREAPIPPRRSAAGAPE